MFYQLDQLVTCPTKLSKTSEVSQGERGKLLKSKPVSSIQIIESQQ